METYPIMIDETLAGKLTVDRQGARTVFEAECRMLPGLVRLSVYGGGKEGYLGVLAPEDGKLRLHKTLSRAQMRAFPEEIASAERAGLRPHAAPPAAETEAQAENGGDPAPEAARGTEMAAGEVPEDAVVSEEQGETEPAAEAVAEAEAEAEEPEVPAPEPSGLSWYSSPDGALVCFDGTRSLIALPLGDARIPEGIPGERRTVEGREYLVYRTREGRIARE